MIRMNENPNQAPPADDKKSGSKPWRFNEGWLFLLFLVGAVLLLVAKIYWRV